MKYKVSLGAIFKNEELNIIEWMYHYIHRGIEHFYLINDNSNDNFYEKILSFIDSGLVTLYHNDVEKFSGRQEISYDKFLMPNINNSEWFIVADLDEFLYSPKNLNLYEIFTKYIEYNILYVNWLNFNSNGNKKHPESIIKSCNKRMEKNQSIYAPTPDSGWCHQNSHGQKYIINSKISKVNSLGVHDCNIESPKRTINCSYMSNYDDYDLVINHYTTQSRFFWEKCKMSRGDVNNWHPDDARNWEYFNALDIGDVIDNDLINQNKKYGIY